MKDPKRYELPSALRPKFEKAGKMEWFTLGYLTSVVILMYLVTGSSQAMKTAWLEDALSMVPAISFLVASRFYNRKPNKEFPYGYHRVYGIAFLCGALALFGMGIFLVIDSAITLIKKEHPSINSIMIFGRQYWMGWIMIIVLLYSSLPSVLLGRKKLPLAKQLHNKILYTDADAQKADYMTAFAAIAGILGVGAGWWWADAAAALFISFSVLKDGYKNLRSAIKELMSRHPVPVGSEKEDKLVEEVRALVLSWDWVRDARVRFREEGQIYFGEVIVTVTSYEDLTTRIEEGLKMLSGHHWKIYDVVIMPVNELPSPLEDKADETGKAAIF